MTKKKVEAKLREFFKINFKGDPDEHIAKWMNAEVPAFDGRKPIDMMETEEGREEIYTDIIEFEIGLFNGFVV